MLWGQKYKISEVLEQLEACLSMFKTFLEESPTAAQILDLDNLSGMRSETIKGDPMAWKRLHFYLLKLFLQNKMLFDYVKYEVLRAELDADADNKNRWVLWEQKTNHADLTKLGCISGLLLEAVHQGSLRRGIKKREEQFEPEYENNYWATSPKVVYISGRITQDNIDVLEEMSDRGNTKIDRRILFPGVTLAYLRESDAFNFFKDEHNSRNTIYNVIFKLNFDLEKGRTDYHDKDEKYFGSLKVCFDLPKLMENDADFED